MDRRSTFNEPRDTILELRDYTKAEWFDIGDTVAEVRDKLKTFKAYMEKCIAA